MGTFCAAARSGAAQQGCAADGCRWVVNGAARLHRLTPCPGPCPGSLACLMSLRAPAEPRIRLAESWPSDGVRHDAGPEEGIQVRVGNIGPRTRRRKGVSGPARGGVRHECDAGPSGDVVSVSRPCRQSGGVDRQRHACLGRGRRARRLAPVPNCRQVRACPIRSCQRSRTRPSCPTNPPPSSAPSSRSSRSAPLAWPWGGGTGPCRSS